jgi:fumarate hydratase class II
MSWSPPGRIQGSPSRATPPLVAPSREHIAANLAQSRMLVTALHLRIGYDGAVKIGKLALRRRSP